MYPTVAVEGSDSFDAISRSFSYVFARPWRMLFYTGVAVVYGAICYLFVRFFIWIMLAATWFFVSWFLGHHGPPGELKHPADVWPMIWPQPGVGVTGTTDPNNPLPYSPNYDALKGTEAVAAGLIVWWVYLVIGLIGAFAISFYFSANTIIYYLMRREVDATELDDVYVEEADDEVEEPAAAATSKIKETSTVRVYETEEGAPAPRKRPRRNRHRPRSLPRPARLDIINQYLNAAPVAQLDRASVFGTEGWRFESFRVRFPKPLNLWGLRHTAKLLSLGEITLLGRRGQFWVSRRCILQPDHELRLHPLRLH